MYSPDDKNLIEKIEGKLKADNVDPKNLDSVKKCLGECVCPGLYEFYELFKEI